MKRGVTVVEFLERFRANELTIRRSITLWLRLDRRLHPVLPEGWTREYRSDKGTLEDVCPHGIGHHGVHGCDGCCKAFDRPVYTADRAKKAAATRLRQAQEKLDAELEARGLAPDGKPYSQPEELKSFLQRSPRGQQ